MFQGPEVAYRPTNSFGDLAIGHAGQMGTCLVVGMIGDVVCKAELLSFQAGVLPFHDQQRSADPQRIYYRQSQVKTRLPWNLEGGGDKWV
jgi:hypothetical protein